MSCNNLTSVELKKILVAADVKGRSKYTTKVEMCKVIQKLGLLLPGTTSKVRSIKSSKTAVSSKKSHAKSNKVAIKTISKKLRTKEAARNRKVLTGLGDDKDNEAIWAKAAEAYKMKLQKAKEAKKEHELNLQKSKQAEEAKKEKELELQTAREEAEEEMKLKKEEEKDVKREKTRRFKAPRRLTSTEALEVYKMKRQKEKEEETKQAEEAKQLTPLEVYKMKRQKEKEEKEAKKQKELELVHNLIAHGFIPKHKSDEADEALKFLESIVKHFSPTEQCIGNNQHKDWLEYLWKQEQFHPSLEVTERLILRIEEGTLKGRLPGMEYLDRIRKQIAKHKNTIVPLRIEYGAKDAHANMIFININSKRFEWFEPHGYVSKEFADNLALKAKEQYNDTLTVKKFIQEKLPFVLHLPNDYQFVMPFEECPYVAGPQAKQKHDVRCSNGGFCRTYSIVYAHLRVLAPDATPAQTVQALLNMSDEQILDFIRRYIAWQNAAGFHSGEV